MSKRNGAYISCEVCEEDFYLPKNRLERTGILKLRYCGRACAAVGRVRGRAPWNKGKTKLTDPKLAAVAEAVRRLYAQDPARGRGENHPMWGRKHTDGARMKMSASQRQ